MKATRLFAKFRDVLNDPNVKVVVARGGTRSSKTMSICLVALEWLLSSDEEGYWSVCRKTLPALKASALRDFLFLVNAMGVAHLLDYNKTELTFTFANRTVEFFSLDMEQKIRSRKRTHLHLVEANEIDFETFTQLIIRTFGKVYLDFNPDDINVWINDKIEQERASLKGDVCVIVSTYLDNNFLSAAEISEIEYLRNVDPELWSIFGLGEYGLITGLIYKKYTLVDEVPEDVEKFIGLDWGFTKDPTAALYVAKQNNRLYLDEIIYQRGIINSEIGAVLKPLRKPVVADSAEPKSIEDLSRQGVSVVPSLKGPDSVRNGIDAMKEFDLCVTKKSINLIKELTHYKLDSQGVPVDAYNHLLDAARYVVQTKFKRSNVTGQTIKVNKYANMVR